MARFLTRSNWAHRRPAAGLNLEPISLGDTIPNIEDFRNIKFQAPNSNEIQHYIIGNPNRFVILNFGHCDLFVICYL
jgi:hypothetical protein